MFTDGPGEPIHPHSISQNFERIARRAAVRIIRLHDLATRTARFAAGVHPKVVSDRLGHATVAFTLDVYSHAVPALQEEAAERVAALVFKPAR